MAKKIPIRQLLVVVACCGLVGCGAAISERHYFASVTNPPDGSPKELVNIFRLEVDAQGGMTNIRYISGEYDERAVDFFFNEVKADEYAPSTIGAKGVNPIFIPKCPETDSDGKDVTIKACNAAYKGGLSLIPIAGGSAGTAESAEFQSFVMILSTNADAIAETIGAFSENTIAMSSISYLLNQDSFEQSAELKLVSGIEDDERKAVKASLSGLFETYDQPPPAGSPVTPDQELAILSTLAVALNPEANISFDSIEQARTWFGMQQ